MSKSQTDFNNFKLKIKLPNYNHDNTINNTLTPKNNDQSTAINTDKGSFT